MHLCQRCLYLAYSIVDCLVSFLKCPCSTLNKQWYLLKSLCYSPQGIKKQGTSGQVLPFEINIEIYLFIFCFTITKFQEIVWNAYQVQIFSSSVVPSKKWLQMVTGVSAVITILPLNLFCWLYLSSGSSLLNILVSNVFTSIHFNKS